MTVIVRISIISILLLLVVLSTLTSCSPIYVLRAAYVESGILLRRQDIADVLANPATTDAERQKLSTVAKAREFAISIGLTPGESFTKYSRVDGDVLAWVLMASRPDAFELRTWWFPIVGSVPYKGFFSKESAEKEGKLFAEKGYEYFIRGTDAFSTLGWFNDPVLSTILKHPDVRIANTIIHESVHATVWIPNYVDFNETFANFVGAQGALDFYRSLEKQCAPQCSPEVQAQTRIAQAEYLREFEFAAVVDQLYSELKELYSSQLSRDEKLLKREEVFARHIVPLRQKYPKMRAFQQLNNAEIMQLRVYLTDLELFRALFEKSRGEWPVFLAEIGKIKQQVEKDSSQNPFLLLKAML